MKYKFIGTTERVFPEFSLTVSEGDIVELDRSPSQTYFIEIDEAKPQAKINIPVIDTVEETMEENNGSAHI